MAATSVGVRDASQRIPAALHAVIDLCRRQPKAHDAAVRANYPLLTRALAEHGRTSGVLAAVKDLLAATRAADAPFDGNAELRELQVAMFKSFVEAGTGTVEVDLPRTSRTSESVVRRVLTYKILWLRVPCRCEPQEKGVAFNSPL